MTKKLAVYLDKIFTGIFEQDVSGRLSFLYDPKYLKSSGAKPLSISLPLQADSFEDKLVKPFFSGLLPDDRQREVLAKNLGESEKNPFALLSKVGGDCAGAIEITLPNKDPISNNKSTNIALTENKLEQIIKELPSHPLLAGTSKVRLSLAGAQSKLAVFFDEKKDSFPHLLDNIPSTHILKPAISDLPNITYNEFFCMRLAKITGLDVAEVFLKFVKKNPYLLIRRYDRNQDSKGRISRIHQEDFCQAMSISPDLKYENQGGPSIASSLQLIEKNSIHPALDKLKFIQTTIFNYIIGNCDAHGKNFSFLHVKNGVKLAPLYDLVCTASYEKLDQKMAMKIGSTYEPQKLFLRYWHRMVPDTNTAISGMNKELQNFAKKLPKLSKDLQKSLEKEGIESEIFNKICDVIEKRSAKILGYF